MKKRYLKPILTLMAMFLILGTVCIVETLRYGYKEAKIQTTEEMLKTNQENNSSADRAPKEEVTKSTNKKSLYENEDVILQTETSDIQATTATSTIAKLSEISTTSTTLVQTTTITELTDFAQITQTTQTTLLQTTPTIITTADTTVYSATTYSDTEETTIETEPTSTKLEDCLIIKNNIIQITYGPANQEMVDENDVVQDTEYWSDERNKYFFGHNVRSFSCLFEIEIGDIITVINNGIETKYKVFKCEQGILTDDGFNIKSNVDDTNLVFTDYGCDTIRLITCCPVVYPRDYRFVVIGEKIE